MGKCLYTHYSKRMGIRAQPGCGVASPPVFDGSLVLIFVLLKKGSVCMNAALYQFRTNIRKAVPDTTALEVTS